MLRSAVALTLAVGVSAPVAAQDWPPFVAAVQGALFKSAVDLSAVEVEFFQGDDFNRQCTNSAQFMDTVQGVSAAILYYTIAERAYRGMPVDGELSYPPYLDYEPWGSPHGIDAADLADALGPDGPVALLPEVVGWIPDSMRPMALASASYLLDTFSAVKDALVADPALTPYAMQVIQDSWGTEGLYYDLGLPASADPCFTQPFHLRMTVNGERTYVSLVALDHYAYTFWIRRLAEQSAPDAFALLQSAADALR